MSVIYGVVDLASGAAVPVAVDADGRLVVVIEGGFAGTAVVANNGVTLPIGSLAKTVSYNAIATEAYVDIEFDGLVYRKTITYIGGRLAGESGWEAQ